MARPVTAQLPPQTALRCSERIPLEPETDEGKLRERTMLAAWESEIQALLADGWYIERANKMMHPPTGTYRLYNELRRTDG